MAVTIRMSRGGRRNVPFYRIVVADSSKPRDGRYIERVGMYNPLLKNEDANRVVLVKDRIQYWLSQGAKPSERVAIFLGKAGIIEMPKQPNRPNKAKQSEKTLLRIQDKQEKRAKAAEAAEAAKAAEKEAKAAAEAAAKAAAEAPAPAPEPEAAPAEAAAEAAAAAEEPKAE